MWYVSRWLAAVLLCFWANLATADPPLTGLPPDAREVVEHADRDIAAIREKAENEAQARREKVIAELKLLQDRYCREAKLDEALAIRDAIRSMQQGGKATEADPGTLVAYRDQLGVPLFFEVTGTANGATIWGTDYYTDDSALAVAAVHAGVLRDGERGVVKVIVSVANGPFTGSMRNGIDSHNWTSWPSGYTISRVEGKIESVEVRGERKVQPDPGTLGGYRDQLNVPLYFEVTGNPGGSTIWGTDFYTDDSALAVAVVHAGILREGERGLVKVVVSNSVNPFSGSTRNGVTSHNWTSWPCGYTVARAEDAGDVRVERKEPVQPKVPVERKVQLDPGALTGFRDQLNVPLYFEVTGRSSGATIWGADFYTDDSMLAIAAVHAGVLADGERGVLKVIISNATGAFTGATRNGITSHNWTSWPCGYTISRE